MSKQKLSRSARDRAVREVADDMGRQARAMASALFDQHGRRMAAAHPGIRASTFIRHFERAWLGAVRK